MKFTTLSIGFALLFISLNAQAHPGPAKEFAYLKKTGEWFSYIENHTYLEVVGTRFIGLEIASNETRTCLFGFNQPDFSKTLLSEAKTGFVCFAKDSYAFVQMKEYCIAGEEGCEIDPAGISIGIGNIEIYEPTIEALPNNDLTPIQTSNYFSRYPKAVTIKFTPPAIPRPSVPFAMPRRYIPSARP